ncbi:MAG: RHS repeat-associated core domain-containing protein [Clostridia bacterium]|nr:RHS repeat-associated core domain-containing protein [Clostridia bacterium]
MRKRFLLNLIAIVLVLTFAINFVPANAIEYIVDSISQETDSVLTEDVDSNINNLPVIDGEVTESEDIDTTSPAKILNEATEYRSINVKTFRMSDGTYQSVMYPRPVHYQHNNIWKEIDNTLTYTDDKLNTYTTTDMPYTVTFEAKTNGNKLVTYDTGEISASLTPAYIENGKAKKLSSKIDKSNIEVSDNYAFYGDVYENADLEYTVEAYRIKENIIVNSKSDTYEYAFILNIDKKAAEVKLENGVINIYQKGDAEPSLYISAPVMTDNNGNRSDLVTLNLTQQKEGEYIVFVTADSDWINDEARCFPVKIDPTIEDYIYNGFDNACSWDGDYGYDYLLFEDDAHAYFTYALPQIPSNAKILDSKLSFYLYMPRSMSDVSTGYITISAYPVTSSWDSNDIQDGIEPTKGVMLDKGVYNANITFSGTNVSLDITSLVTGWYQGQANYGIMLDTQFSNVNMTLTGSLDYYDDIYITTSFAIAEGLNNKWSTHTISADDRAGIAYIKDLTGEAIYVHPDISTNGNLLPVSISHVYNKNFNSHANYYGTGWTLNVLQTMKAVTIYSPEIEENNYYYLHTDSTGNKTYYYRDPDVSNIYINENDPLVEYNSTTRTITYPDGSDIAFNADGYICQVYDYNTNSFQTYTYSSPGKISRIEDGAGREIIFTYNSSGYLLNIYPLNMPSRALTFSYNSSGALTTITYSDATYTAFNYSTTNGLYRVRFYNTSSIYNTLQLTFSAGKVSKARTYYTSPESTTIYDNVLTFTYGATTKVTYSDSSSAGANDYYETIYFDNAGRTIGIVDKDGYFAYGQYASGDLAQFDVLERNTTGKVAVENLIPNGDFRKTDTQWTAYNSSNATVNVISIPLHAQNPELGDYGLRVINRTSAIDYAFASHPINAVAGETYTISAVLATHTFNSDGDGIVIGFKYIDSNANLRTVYSEPNCSGGYERIAYTFTFPEGSFGYEALIGVYGSNFYGVFDLIQLETGASANEYNFVENSMFANGLSDWSTAGPVAGTVMIDGYKAAYVTGTTYGENLIYQNINLTLEADTQISVGGWGKANAYSNGLFGIRVTFKNTTTGASEEEEILFDYKITDWQYANEIISVPIDCDRITVAYMFCENDRGAYFRGLSFEIVNLFDETSDGAKYTYDLYGRVIHKKNNDGSSLAYEYDSGNGYVAEEISTDTQGNVTTTIYEYNKYNNRNNLDTIKSTCVFADDSDDLYIETNYIYDDKGNLLSESTQQAAINQASSEISYVEYTYSNEQNVCTSVTDKNAQTTTYEYNDLDELILETSPEYVVTEYTYNPAGHLTKVTQHSEIYNDEKVVEYEYTNGRLSQIGHNSFDYYFEYNNNRDVTKIQVGNTTSKYTLADYEYNGAFGQVSKMTYGNGQYENYVYDDYGRLLFVTYNQSAPSESNATYIWSYDDRGDLVATKANGITTSYSYDSEGRIKTVIDSLGNSIWQRYYSKDNKSEYSYLSGGKSSHTKFVYEAIDGQMQNKATITSDSYDVTTVVNQGDKLGRVVSQTTTNDNSSKGYRVEYDYNSYFIMYDSARYGMNETSEIKEIEYYRTNGSTSTKLLPTLSYTYYEDGNIEDVKENNVLKITYYYDEFDQLIRENNKYLNNGSGYTITYSYDDGGNMLEKKVYSYTTAINVTNLTPIDTITYGYDSVWKDMMTSIDGEAITRDAIGNPTNYPGVSDYIYWSEGNKVESISWPEDSYWAYVAFLYNENGLRSEKNMYAAGVRAIKYFWLDNVLQSEYCEMDGYEIIYCYDANGSLIGFTYETSTSRTFYRYVMNLQGDVIALLDENYDVVVKYTYDTWGKVLSVTDANGTLITDTNHIGHRNPIRYRGYYYDIETGLYYLQSRYYDPEVGRFINCDSQLNNDITGNNLFIYCGNNPVMRADMQGEGWHILIGAIIGSLVSGASQIITNVKSGKKWSSDLIGAVVGGGVSGAISAAGGPSVASTYAGTGATYVVNEICSYIPGVAKFNGNETHKEITEDNIRQSFYTVVYEGGASATKSFLLGKIFKPIGDKIGIDVPDSLKGVTSFKTYSKYGIKTTMEAGMESSHCIINEYIQDRIIPFGKDKLQLPYVEVFPTL